MATRLYIPSTGTPAIAPTFGAGWEGTGEAVRRTLVTTRINSAMDTTPDTYNGAGIGDRLVVQGILEGLAAQTISGTFKGQIRGVQTNAGAGARLSFRIAKCSADGSSVTEIVALTQSTDSANTPPIFVVEPTAPTNRRIEEGDGDYEIAIPSTSLDSGDVLIVEIGHNQNSGNTTRYGRLVLGDDSGTDLAEDESTTTANNPWVEFSVDLAFGGGASAFPHQYYQQMRR